MADLAGCGGARWVWPGAMRLAPTITEGTRYTLRVGRLRRENAQLGVLLA